VRGRGSCFTSKRLNEYCNAISIKVNYNATATPRANSQAERYNRTVLNALSTSTDDERKWDEGVKSIQWGLNTSLNKTTGKTPYVLLLRYRPRQANDSFLSAEVCDTQYDEHLSVTRELTSERIREKQAEQKARYDLSRRPTPTYYVGQQVLVRKVVPTNDGKSKKLLQKYSGPYVIKKILDCDRLIISDLQGTSRSQRPYESVVSLVKMKPYNMAPGSDIDSSSDPDE
jgi:hypothetical protein